jgi:predicted membrane-bound spermidine synthase
MSAKFRYSFYLLFALSGFSALIYESIWSHYMKLFLGHAAYAQTLVLAIFMGGMAIGAVLCGKYSPRYKNLLKGYALVEGVIGLFALLFHDVFDSITQFSYTAVIQHLDIPMEAHAFKWILSAILILPQSILIGMPFPLMSAAIIRMFPQRPGKSLSMLYFANSFGAAIGVLVSGFLLIKAVGLPGTIRAAGLINIALALTVWVLSGRYNSEYRPAVHPATAVDGPGKTGWYRPLLIISLLTGTASFIYEIGWIRMLSLVMGSSTHAFELMLSAFILGLAFGALWIQRRIDRITNPIRFLVMVQVIMGLFALATLPVYGNTFTVMQWLIQTLSKTDAGYQLFNLYSYTIALAVMLPTTFCAGSTLPLITYALIKEGHGEKSIGTVYAANTVGAIFGIFFAIHLGMPLLGLKGLIMLGGSLDITLGLALLWMTAKQYASRRMPAVLTTVCVVAVLAAAFLVELDPYKMASGLYRYNSLLNPEQCSIMYHKDGKTATVSLTLGRNGTMSIRTNGKPDASINMNLNMESTPDEATMVLAAVIPMGLHPQAKSVANIGLGSGLTAHTLLCNPSLQHVDTVEIEPGMVEAAKNFGPRVNLVYKDPRSKIYIDDAKTFFSTNNKKYDIIISEPSNPWVSGVGGLFSEEFYRMINANLSKDGIFVQWLQLYEIDDHLVASVLKALNPNFSDFVAFAPNNIELLIVARKDGAVGELDATIFKNPVIARALESVHIKNSQDIEIRKIGDKRTLSGFVSTFPIRANSDYYPVLDQNAAKARFMKAKAGKLHMFSHDPLPTTEMLTKSAPAWRDTVITPTQYYYKSEAAFGAMACRDYFLTGSFGPCYREVPSETRQAAVKIRQLFQERGTVIQENERMAVLSSLARMIPYLRPEEMMAVWKNLESVPGGPFLSAHEKALVKLFKAVGSRDAAAMTSNAHALLTEWDSMPPDTLQYTVAGGMLGYLSQGNGEEARHLWSAYRYRVFGVNEPDILFRLFVANSAAADFDRKREQMHASERNMAGNL